MTFQALQAASQQSTSSTFDDYIPTGTDLAEASAWAKLNGKDLEDLDDLSDDFADAGFVPRDDSTI